MFDFPPVDRDQAFDVLDVMAATAETRDASVAQVALAWLLAKPTVTSVIIGAKRMDQLRDNLGAVDIRLSADEVTSLDEVSARPRPYPMWMLALGDDRRPGEIRDLAAMLKKKH